MYDNENKTIDTTWNLKWKTSTEDWLVETLSLIRKQKKPTQEQQYALAKARECHMTVPLPSNPIVLEEDKAGN